MSMKEQLKKTGKRLSYEEGLNYSIKLISRYVYTSKQLIDKLNKKNISNNDINKIINYLNKHNLINDYQLAIDYSYELIYRGKGQNYIKDKLFNKGIDKSIINEVIKNINQDDLLSNLENKIKLLINKYHKLDNIKVRVIKNCLSSGYYLTDINKIINKLIKDSKIKEMMEENYDLY